MSVYVLAWVPPHAYVALYLTHARSLSICPCLCLSLCLFLRTSYGRVLVDHVTGRGRMDLVMATAEGEVVCLATQVPYHPLRARQGTHQTLVTHTCTPCVSSGGGGGSLSLSLSRAYPPSRRHTRTHICTDAACSLSLSRPLPRCLERTLSLSLTRALTTLCACRAPACPCLHQRYPTALGTWASMWRSPPAACIT
jgi:hypothetical protein